MEGWDAIRKYFESHFTDGRMAVGGCHFACYFTGVMVWGFHKTFETYITECLSVTTYFASDLTWMEWWWAVSQDIC